MARVLVVGTSPKTRGGITSVITAYKQTGIWKKYHCLWLATHRDGPAWRKAVYFLSAFVVFLIVLPFFDIVHCHCALGTSGKRKLIFVNVAKFFHKKVIVHFHPSTPELFCKTDNLELGKSLFEKADLIITLSPFWENRINLAYPGNEFKMVVLWNPCISIPKMKIRRKQQILYAGTLLKRKGYDVLLRSFAIIANQHSDWKLVFAGNPYLLDGVDELKIGKQLSKELGIENQVEWLGWVSGTEKERVFRQSSIYCLASEGEGFPMGVLDAWSYGIPCVMTPVGGLPDVVVDGKNGLFFPVGDVDTLSKQLEKLIVNENLRHQIVCGSDELLSKYFDINILSERLDEIYQSLS